MYGEKKVYEIELNLNNFKYEENKIEFTINKLKKKIINLNKYYRQHKFRKLIVFSKFYYFLNELLFILCPDYIKTHNISYKNPKRMLELFIVLESIIKYYN